MTGTLIKIGEGSALVELDGRDKLRDFETIDHKWVRFVESGKKRTTITKSVDVVVI